eukprot:8100009-Pyramimonas_sp.AAC.1
MDGRGMRLEERAGGVTDGGLRPRGYDFPFIGIPSLPVREHMSTLTPMQIVDVSMDDEKVLMPEVAVLVPAAPAVPGETSSSEDSLIGGGAPDDSIPETEMVEFARWLKIQG